MLGRAGQACWGAQGKRAGARRASVARAAGGGWVGERAGERQLGAGAGGRQGAGRAAWVPCVTPRKNTLAVSDLFRVYYKLNMNFRK